MVPPCRGEVEAADESRLCGGQEMAGTAGRRWGAAGWRCPDAPAVSGAAWEDRGM